VATGATFAVAHAAHEVHAFTCTHTIEIRAKRAR
jgi:hypothetical protein